MAQSDVTLFQAAQAWGMPNASPFCVKVEMFLRVAKIPYEQRPFNPMKAPKGKMPYIAFRGEMIADSQIIITRLQEALGLDLDASLSAEQKARGHAVRRMLEEAAYFAIMWQRWCVDANWPVVKREYFRTMPPVVRDVLPEILRRGMKKAAVAQGTGRHSHAEIDAMLSADLESVALQLKGPYFFGDTLTSIDLTVFPFLNLLLKSPLPTPLATRWQKHQPFIDYCDRINATYFPDIPSSR